MFIELINTEGCRRYVNPDHVVELSRWDDNNWRVAFSNGVSHFTDYNIENLIGFVPKEFLERSNPSTRKKDSKPFY